MLHALMQFSKAVSRREASMNFRRVLYKRICRNVILDSTAAHPRYYSQHSQDRFIDNFVLYGRRDGVFVDVGAYDGVTLSNTCYFERELGWTGICIEPNPSAYKNLCENRKSLLLNCGVGGKEKVLEFLKLPDKLELGSGFIEYFDDSSIYKSQTFIEQIKAVGGEVIKVQVQDINVLLRTHQLTHIDYLSVDTEGADFDILSSIDFEAFDIRVISIENSCFGDKIISFLSKRDFELRAILGTDEIYMKRGVQSA